jgi:hypothetical protein
MSEPLHLVGETSAKISVVGPRRDGDEINKQRTIYAGCGISAAFSGVREAHGVIQIASLLRPLGQEGQRLSTRVTSVMAMRACLCPIKIATLGSESGHPKVCQPFVAAGLQIGFSAVVVAGVRGGLRHVGQ